MPIVPVDIAAAVRANAESVIARLRPVAGDASQSFLLNQDVCGIAIAPSSAYDQLHLPGIVDGVAANAGIVGVGAPYVSENVGVIPDRQISLIPRGQVSFNGGFMPAADLLGGPDTPIDVIAQFFLVPPTQPPLARLPLRPSAPVVVPALVGASTTAVLNVPAAGRRNWMVNLLFGTIGSITSASLIGREYSAAGVGLGDKILQTAAPATGGLLLQASNVDFTACRVEVIHTGVSTVTVWYSLAD